MKPYLSFPSPEEWEEQQRMKVGDRVRVLPYKTFYEKQGKLRYKIWTAEEDYRGKNGSRFRV